MERAPISHLDRGHKVLKSYGPTAAIAALALSVLIGCTIVVPGDSGERTIYVLGIARLKIPEQSNPTDTTAYELTGIGVAVGRLFQIGYFHQFEAWLVPGSNSALVLVRSPEELEHLENTLRELNQRGICIIAKS